MIMSAVLVDLFVKDQSLPDTNCFASFDTFAIIAAVVFVASCTTDIAAILDSFIAGFISIHSVDYTHITENSEVDTDSYYTVGHFRVDYIVKNQLVDTIIIDISLSIASFAVVFATNIAIAVSSTTAITAAVLTVYSTLPILQHIVDYSSTGLDFVAIAGTIEPNIHYLVIMRVYFSHITRSEFDFTEVSFVMVTLNYCAVRRIHDLVECSVQIACPFIASYLLGSFVSHCYFI